MRLLEQQNNFVVQSNLNDLYEQVKLKVGSGPCHAIPYHASNAIVECNAFSLASNLCQFKGCMLQLKFISEKLINKFKIINKLRK